MTVPDRRERYPLGATVTFDALADDPYPLFHELRAAEPVTWAPQLGMWLLTRRDDIVRVLADWERFTTDSPRSTIRDIFGSHMLTTDGDTQIRYKRRFIGPFRRGRLEESLLATVQGVLDGLMGDLRRAASDMGGRKRADLRSRIARPLSVRSICRVLGLPDGDGDTLLGWYDHFAAALENFAGDPAVRARGKAAAREFREYVTPFLRAEREVPEGSMIAALQSEADPYRPGRPGERGGGDPLSETEMVANLLVVLFGGIETTESMIGNALWAALSHPEVAERVAAACSGEGDPAAGGPGAGRRTANPLLVAAIEESMRWEPAVQSCMRFTTEDVEIRGVPVAKGETVHCFLGAANRDPAHFPDPDRFDPDRGNVRDHLAFGAGRHFCLGASLARIEAEESLRSVFGSLPGLRLDPERPTRPYGHEFRTPPAVWVRWG